MIFIDFSGSIKYNLIDWKFLYSTELIAFSVIERHVALFFKIPLGCRSIGGCRSNGEFRSIREDTVTPLLLVLTIFKTNKGLIISQFQRLIFTFAYQV